MIDADSNSNMTCDKNELTKYLTNEQAKNITPIFPLPIGWENPREGDVASSNDLN
jgi:hypothetical protein